MDMKKCKPDFHKIKELAKKQFEMYDRLEKMGIDYIFTPFGVKLIPNEEKIMENFRNDLRTGNIKIRVKVKDTEEDYEEV